MEDQLQIALQDTFLSRPTNQLLADFGAGNAAPGSGSAAALMGLLAARLIQTVCTKSKEHIQDERGQRTFDFIDAHIRSKIEPDLRSLFEKDAEDFNTVIELRRARLAARSTSRKSALQPESNDRLELATDNVFAIAQHCDTLVEYSVTMFENGWHAVRGDSGAAVGAGIAGVMSCIFIANLNMKRLKNRVYAREHVTTCSELYKTLQRRQTRAFRCVTSLNTEAVKAIQIPLHEA